MVHHHHHHSKVEKGASKFFKHLSHSPIVKELGRDAQAIVSMPSTSINAVNKVTTAGANALSSNMNIFLYLGVGVVAVMVISKMNK